MEEVDDLQYELTFGDGYFGIELADGATINVTYLVTNGNLANGIQGVTNYGFIGQIYDSYGTRINDRPTVTSVGISNGGDQIEDVTSIKNRAPKFYASQNRCVISEDYETLIKEIYPGVDDIYVYGGETMSPPEFGRVYAAVKPKGGDALSALTKNYIKKSLTDYRVASIDIQLVDPVVLYVEMDSVAYFDDKKTAKDNSGISTIKRPWLDTAKQIASPSSVVLFVTPASCLLLMTAIPPSPATTPVCACVVTWLPWRTPWHPMRFASPMRSLKIPLVVMSGLPDSNW